ncbi:NK-tumor recognition protein-like isoform X5 [Erythrolamprus reginae]|uniref:NK-tumor recognition protein-like isoform X5 n=1 Tax=Erythrolamprus reginae TaxID=121349 RepID=UPI00396C54FA
MDRGLPPQRCHDQWFNQNNMPYDNFSMANWHMPQNEFPEGLPPSPWYSNENPHENFLRDTWHMPQNVFPERPPYPSWYSNENPHDNFSMDNWHMPQNEFQGSYNIGFDNCTRGSYHRGPYRGRSYSRPSGRSKKTSKGRGNFQNSSSSPFINAPPKKTFKKVKKQPEDSKKFEQDKGNTATSVEKDKSSKVQPKDSQLDEVSPTQTDSVASPKAVAEEKPSSGITKISPHIQNQDIVLNEKEVRESRQVVQPKVLVIKKKKRATPRTEKKVLKQQASQSAQDSSHVYSSSATKIPFLSDNADDDRPERKEELELVQLKDSQLDEVPPTQTDSVASPKAVAEEKSSSGITKISPHTQNQDIVLNEKEVRESRQVVQPKVLVIKKKKRATPRTEKKVLKQASQSAQDSSHVYSSTATKIPFLSDNADDDRPERKEELELPKKTFKKVKKQPEDSKKFEQDKGNTATSVEEDKSSKVQPKDSQLDEVPPTQTDSVASPKAVAEEKSSSGITKISPHTQNQDIVLNEKEVKESRQVVERKVLVIKKKKRATPRTEKKVLKQQANQSAQDSSHVYSSTAAKIPFLSDNADDDRPERKEELELRNFSFKLKDWETTEDLLSQTVSILSPGVSTEDKTSSCSVKVLQNIEEKDSVLNEKEVKESRQVVERKVLVIKKKKRATPRTEKKVLKQQASQSAQDSSHGIKIPFLSDNADDDQPERREELELTETSAKQNDTDDSQAHVVAPALDSSNLANTPIDVYSEPVLVREKNNELTETSAQQNDTVDSQAYIVTSVIDSSNLPNTLSDIHCESVLVSGKDTGLTETSAKQNDTDESQAYVVTSVFDSSNLPNILNDIPYEHVLVIGIDTGLTETSATQNDTDDSQAYVVAPVLDSSNLPISPIDVHCEPVLVREKDNELIETSVKKKDTDDSQACAVVPALDSSTLPNTLNDIRCVPVLMGRKVIGLQAENQRAWAPEDYQEPPWSVNQADQYFKVSECYKDSVSTTISSNEKHNIESLVKSKSSSPKIHHIISSKHSSINQTSRDLKSRSPRSYVRQEYSSRSSGKQNLSTERQDRSSKLSCRREHSSGSSHKQEDSPQREKHISKSPYRQEQSSQKRDCSPKTSLKKEHGVKSMSKRKHSSNSPPKRKQSSKSQKLDRWKEKKLGRSCCCRCYCHCQHSCSPYQENLWQRCCSPSYLTCKIEHLRVPKEVKNVYEMPNHLCPRKSPENEKEIRESREVVEPNVVVTEKKKRATLRTERKALKSSTKKKKTSSSCHLNAEEETNSSIPSWTPEDRSAAVLAKKEELEQAYLQVLLNFGVIAIMLVEKEPCMVETVSSALRANLRKIGDYYECLLKNYIDSLTEAS